MGTASSPVATRLRAGGNEAALEALVAALDGALMAVAFREGTNRTEVGIPTTLVPADRLGAVIEGPDYDDYAVAADGQRFLVKVPAAQSERQRIHVLLTWTSRVKSPANGPS